MGKVDLAFNSDLKFITHTHCRLISRNLYGVSHFVFETTYRVLEFHFIYELYTLYNHVCSYNEKSLKRQFQPYQLLKIGKNRLAGI